MIVNSVVLGQVEVEEQQTIQFDNGMPGFEELRAFVPLRPDPELPFTYLQSIEKEEVVFLLTDPFVFYPDYDFHLDESVLESLHIREEKDVQIWSVVTMNSDVESATLNLLAPVVINITQKLGKQVILQNTGYSTRHKLVNGPLASSTEEAAADRNGE